jgi:hypothetical protein
MRRMWILTGLSMILCVPALFAATKKASTSAAASTSSATAPPAAQRWAPQSLNGTVSMVDPKLDLVVVKDSSGVPFDITVARNTRIDKGTTREQLPELTPNESVSVRYVPEAHGDIARTIDVGK